MKVLFLDVDGVLNSEQWFTLDSKDEDSYIGLRSISPKAALRVKEVLAQTEAKIVLSSVWRIIPEMTKELEAWGIPIFDQTPVLDTNHRASEISAWLAAHPEVSVFAIIDDDDDAGDSAVLAPRFIQTSWKRGIQDIHVHALIGLLGKCT